MRWVRGAERRMLLGGSPRSSAPWSGCPSCLDGLGAPNGPRRLGETPRILALPNVPQGQICEQEHCIQGIQDGHLKGDGSCYSLLCLRSHDANAADRKLREETRRILGFTLINCRHRENCDASEILREEMPVNDLWLKHCGRRGVALPQAAKCGFEGTRTSLCASQVKPARTTLAARAAGRP